MSDSDFSEDSYLNNEEEDEVSSLDEESYEDDDSEEINIKVKKRSLNKLETKIAMSGKSKVTKTQKRTKVESATEKTASTKKREVKQTTKETVRTQKQALKEAKPPKEQKKTQKQVKEELKEKERQDDAVEDQIYFYQESNLIKNMKISQEIGQLIRNFKFQNKINKEALQQLISQHHLSFPQSSYNFLMKKNKKHSNLLQLSPSLCFEIFEAVSSHALQLKPCFLDSMFFPNKQNEKRLAAILRKAKQSLDICVFAFTNDRLRDAILYAFERGAKVRIITDDECSKFMGADVYSLGEKGILCTMDNNKMVHMHNKFTIVDSLVLVTGSFNWTSQAVNMNQENLIAIQNQHLVDEYQQEFEKLWTQFACNRLSVANCTRRLQEEEVNKQVRIQKMNDGRKQKQAERMQAKTEL